MFVNMATHTKFGDNKNVTLTTYSLTNNDSVESDFWKREQYQMDQMSKTWHA